MYYTDTVNCPQTDSVAITVEICAGVTEATARDGFVVSPNPSNGLFVIRTENGSTTQASIGVIDLVGKKLESSSSTEQVLSWILPMSQQGYI